jgi:hypothetical protein
MNETDYVDFIEAMKAYHYEDCDVLFHGRDNEVRIVFDAKMSEKKISEMTLLDDYTFFELTNGLWSIIR